MGFLDFGRAVRIEHETQEADHLAVTNATTGLHMQADDAEGRGDIRSASDLRAAADGMQTAANRRHRPRSN